MRKHLTSLALAFTLTSYAFASPAYWKSSSFTAPDAQQKVAYSVDLMKYVLPGTKPLRFFLSGGPKWATVSSSGVFAGTPSAADIGNQIFVIGFSDGADSGSVAQMIVKVKADLKPSLVCGDGSAAYLVGHSEDRKLDIFTCNH